jgi:hypothetical protein
MAAPTAEQKQQILGLVREGYNLRDAAKLADVTGTQARRMINEVCVTYDHEFTLAYQAELAARDGVTLKHLENEEERKALDPKQTTPLGYTKARYITDEQREQYLEKIREGVPKEMAARQVGTSLVQFNRVAHRDPEFAKTLKEAYEVGYPNFQEKLRSQAFDLAMGGDYRALRDLLIVHDPRYEFFRSTRHEIGGLGGGPLRVLAEQVLPNLPPELLDEIIKHLEDGDDGLRALPAA